MAETNDMILPMLKEMRAEIAGRFDGVEGKMERIDRRLQKLEEAQTSYGPKMRELEAHK